MSLYFLSGYHWYQDIYSFNKYLQIKIHVSIILPSIQSFEQSPCSLELRFTREIKNKVVTGSEECYKGNEEETGKRRAEVNSLQMRQ